MPGAPLPLCKRCISAAYHFAEECRGVDACALCRKPIGFADRPFDICPECAYRVHTWVDAWKLRSRISRPERPAREKAQGHVYYIRRGDLIKIGFTTGLADRMGALLPDEILAVEPGTFRIEADRHRQFRDFKADGQREWFVDCDELREHIATVVLAHGEPPGLPTLLDPKRGRARGWPPGWVDEKTA